MVSEFEEKCRNFMEFRNCFRVIFDWVSDLAPNTDRGIERKMRLDRLDTKKDCCSVRSDLDCQRDWPVVNWGES